MKPFIIFFILFIGLKLTGQDLANLKNSKPLTLQGSIGTKMSLYGVDGIESRQDPFTYGIDVNATISLYGISMPFAFTWYNRNKSYSTPFNRYGISPTYKWVTGHFGYRNVTFSEYTLNGHTFLGAGFELTPGNWRIGAIYGKFNEKSDYDPYAAKEITQLTRRGYAVKLGYGTEKNFLELSMLNIADIDKDYEPSTDPDMPTPEQNFAMSAHGKATIIKNLSIETEFALSTYTINSKANALKGSMDTWFNISENFLTINQSSEYYSAFKANLKWKINKSLTSGIEYKRIDPGYRSMGAYFFTNDIEVVNINQSVILLNNKINVRGSLGLQHNNLDNTKKYTSKRTVGALNMSYQINKYFGIDASYNNFTTNQKAGSMAVIDSLKLYQVNKTFTITPRYMISSEKYTHMLMLLFTNMALDDKNKTTENQTETNTNILNLTYSVGIIPSKLNISASLSNTKLKNNLYENILTGITLGISKMLLSDKLSLSWNNSYMVNKINDEKGNVVNSTLTAGFRFLKKNNINLNLYYISNQFEEGSNQPSYKEYRGDISYVYTF